MDNLPIPESVETIGANAFHGCSKLTGIGVPKSVTSIGEWAFMYCDNLTTVIYPGSDEDWNGISIGEYNQPIIDAYNNSKCIHEKSEWCVLSDNTKEKVCTNCGAALEFLGADEFIPNDVNGDNKFNMIDYVFAKNVCIEGTDDEALLSRSDVNKDGKVNMFDYIAIKAAYFAQ